MVLCVLQIFLDIIINLNFSIEVELELKDLKPVNKNESDLFKAMKMVGKTKKGQKPNTKYGM